MRKTKFTPLASLNKGIATFMLTLFSSVVLAAELPYEGIYRPPSPDELAAVEKLFVRTLKDEPQSDLAHDWQALGFELSKVGQHLLLLRELPSRREGRGSYMFRRGGRPTALQAPHQRSDRFTGEITLHLMQEGDFAAAAWNSVPRTQADLAHLPDTYFIAFTQAFIEVHDGGFVVQLHGFEEAKRRSDAGRKADLIASTGTRLPSQTVRNFAACAASKLAVRTAVYPDDIKELGGTRNAIGATLRTKQLDTFMHVEMAPELRYRLKEEQPLRAAFMSCLP